MYSRMNIVKFAATTSDTNDSHLLLHPQPRADTHVRYEDSTLRALNELRSNDKMNSQTFVHGDH